MFGGWNITLPPRNSGGPDPTPREPLVLSFPSCSTNSPHDPTFTKGVHQLFRSIRKLPDITPEHLESLNVSVEYDVPLEDFIPTYPPHGSASESSATVQYLPDENGEGPKNATYAERKKELLIPNDHAFDTLQRIRRDIKLGHFYKFYQSLELVSTYYNSKDGAFAGMPERFREDLVKNFVEPICWGYNSRLMPPRSPPRVQFQTSRFATRVDFFAFMTPALQAERKAGMVEGPLMAIQCRHEDYFVYPKGPQCREDSPPPPPEEEEAVNLGDAESPILDNDGDTLMKEGSSATTSNEALEASVEETGAAEAAKKKEEARLAKIEEARRKAAKREEEKRIRIKKGSWPEGDVWDVLKEVGAILCTAQERRKGGKGADGIGKGRVEKKTRYKAIGKESNWWDDVFLISTVHSHISLTNVHISAPYLRFLETGNLPNPDHELIKQGKSGWYEFKMKRTKWYDLGEPEGRVEAARAVSGVLAFLTRNEGTA